jgi:hypothetical protein
VAARENVIRVIEKLLGFCLTKAAEISGLVLIGSLPYDFNAAIQP